MNPKRDLFRPEVVPFEMTDDTRQAGGRRRFEENPGWAKGLMNPLVEAGLIEMNERGHYRVKSPEQSKPETRTQTPAHRPTTHSRNRVVGDDYFPAAQTVGVVGDNYFPR